VQETHTSQTHLI